MIASFTCNFIFVRTRKTASTSTEIVLGAWCGGDDIVTPVGVEDEITRLRYGGSPRNFSTDPELERAYRAALVSGDARAIQPLYKRIMLALDFHHHMSATEIRARVPAAFWRDALKIAVDRHPYEKAVSLAFWRSRAKKLTATEFAAFLDQTIDNGEYRNFDLYAENGVPMVDELIAYENLWPELARIAERLGQSIPAERPRSKAQHRKNRAPATEILSAAQKQRVQGICQAEFDLFGYATD